MRRKALACVVGGICGVAATVGVTSPAHGAQIFQSDSFTISGTTANFGFQEFDPALGALDRVIFSMTGTFGFTITLAPAAALTPVVTLDAVGNGFDFSAAQFLFPAQVNASPTQPLVVNPVTVFSLDFVLNDLTDLTGVVVPTVSATTAAAIPPVSVGALRDDFVQGIVPIRLFETLVFAPTNFGAAITGGGTAFLTYDYTPAPVAPVEEPGSLGLLGLAITGLVAAARRIDRRG